MQDDGSGLFGGTKTQLFAAATGSLFAISDGMTYGWTAPMIPYFISERSHLKTTQHEAEWLETILMAGSVVGIPITIYLVDKIGRKYSMLLAAVASLLGWTTIALASRMLYIFIARFFFGITGNIAFVAAPMYIAEIADHKIRGFLSSVIYLMMLIGLIIVYSVGPYLPFFVAPLIAGIFLIIELCTFSFMPESPYYLLYMDKPEEARQSLEYLRPNRLIDDELEEISKAVKRQKTEGGSLIDLFAVKSNRKAVIIMAALDIGQHLAAISVILMNLHSILEAAGSIYMDSSIAAIIFSVLMFLAAKTASFQIDKYGRKSLLIISTISTAFCLLAIAVYFNLKVAGYDVRAVSWVPIVSVMIYAITFKIGLGIVPIVLTAEIFSAKMKALGMTVADAIYVIGSIISLQMYQWLSLFYGLHVPFYLFSIFSFMIASFTWWYIPETKGKTLEEIQFILKGEDYSPGGRLLQQQQVIYNSFSDKPTFLKNGNYPNGCV